MKQIAARHNAGKTEWCLMPFEAVEQIVRVLSVGARKYAVDNWQRGNQWTDTYNSLMRHLVAWRNGEDRDPESGELHMAHIGCNVVLLLFYHLHKRGTDDRKMPILRNLKRSSK